MAAPATTPARQALLDAYRTGAGLSGALARPLIDALERAWPGKIGGLARDEILAELLASTPIYPVWLEHAMTELRRKLMLGQATEALSGLVSALAVQCYLNEYAWAVAPAEQQRVDELIARVESLGPLEAMLLGCYLPLGRVPGAESLAGRGWTGPVQAVLDEQILAPRLERTLDARIPTVTPIRGGVSEEVRAQYEEHPYPRWRTLQTLPQTPSLYGWRIPPRPNVLIAGCGTGFQAIRSAGRYPDSKVLAADLSRASLVYGYRKAREVGCKNIAFVQADLLELGQSEWRFEIVESSGVLHHMSDPFEGARAICGLLQPGGAIKLGLYSKLARRGLQPAKDLARQYTPATIRELRQAILASPEGDPLRDCARFIDFYSTSSCRDLLMHVQEHELGLADVRRMLSENGLTFLAFVIGAEVLEAYRKRFPEDPDARDLHRWEAFEQDRPGTFSGMYQFWAVKTG